MRDVPISEFKTKCFDLFEQVYRTRRPLRITRRGVPVVERVPMIHGRRRKFVGDMIGTAQIVGDIVSPVISLEEIDAYRD
jgi:hypothetical protein